jgi:hypothetical protein
MKKRKSLKHGEAYYIVITTNKGVHKMAGQHKDEEKAEFLEGEKGRHTI